MAPFVALGVQASTVVALTGGAPELLRAGKGGSALLGLEVG
jgi:tRNA A37 threonylcarbamoyladenosine synthetase subunit TsaC/SUA5/YrdC